MKQTLKLAHGLRAIGGPHRRMLLLAMAFHANVHGEVLASERCLRNETELGAAWFKTMLRELEDAGWVRREGRNLILVISKMKANQRIFKIREEYAARNFGRILVANPGA